MRLWRTGRTGGRARFRSSLTHVRGPEEFESFRLVPGGKMDRAGSAAWPLVGVELVGTRSISVRIPLLVQWAVGPGARRVVIRAEDVSRVDRPTPLGIGVSIQRGDAWEYYRMSFRSTEMANTVSRALSAGPT